jgi:hypothetical protein
MDLQRGSEKALEQGVVELARDPRTLSTPFFQTKLRGFGCVSSGF